MIIKFINSMKNKVKNQDGQAVIEYVLILILISILAVTALTEIGNQLILKFNEVTAGF